MFSLPWVHNPSELVIQASTYAITTHLELVMHPWINSVRQSLIKRTPPVFCVHYACDWLHSVHRSTSIVTAVSVRLLGFDQTKVYSLGLMAEREGIARDEIAAHRDKLERAMLEEFWCFLERMHQKYPSALWFHWAMRDTTFGWPMLEHRAQKLLQRSLPLDAEQLIDLHATLVAERGREFVARPQLLQLAELNGLSHADLLTGQVEAESLGRGDYFAISRSTARKAETIGHLLVHFVEGSLRTNRPRLARRRQRWTAITAESLPRELIGVDEASRLCGLSRASWYRLLAGAKIPQPIRIGRRTLWDAKELRLWIDSECPVQKVWRVQRRLHGLGRRKG